MKKIIWIFVILFLVSSILFTGCAKLFYELSQDDDNNPFDPNGTDNGNGISAPTGVNASQGNYTDRIIISWDSVSGANRYNIYRSTSSEGSYENVYEAWDTTYEDWYLPAGGTYYHYKIKAISDGRESDFSIWFSGYQKILPTDSVYATDGSYPDRIIINWNYVAGTKYYEVHSSTSWDGVYSQIGDTWLTPGGTSYTNGGLLPGTTYYYKIKSISIDPQSESDLSGWDSGYTQ